MLTAFFVHGPNTSDETAWKSAAISKWKPAAQGVRTFQDKTRM